MLIGLRDAIDQPADCAALVVIVGMDVADEEPGGGRLRGDR